MKWTYGVTTTKQRLHTLLPQTVRSLHNGGFPHPRLFVDGAGLPSMELRDDCYVSRRVPRIKTAGNWHLALTELYFRNPTADRFAIFQDDLLCVRNLRQYLESVVYQVNTYWNLYTFPQCYRPARRGFYESPRRGKGAVALVFSRTAAIDLLTSRTWVERIQDSWKSIDGGIHHALGKLKYRELVHNPSLVQHTGDLSTMSNPKHPKANSFPGENFDALTLIPTDDTGV